MSQQLSEDFHNVDTHTSRKEELDRLFDNLSPWDILYLRKKIEATTITLASFGDLPPELICAVLSNIEFDDYRFCNRVCRKWKEIWSQETVLRQALRQFFPGLQLTYPKTSPQDLYALEVQKHLKWRLPHCKYTWIPWNMGTSDVFIDPSEFTQSGAKLTHVPWIFHYNKDKLVWQSTPRSFIIDDLRTRQRLRFLPPGSVMSGAEYEAAAISDRLLVLLELNVGGRTIHVVHFETREWKQLTLPTSLQHAYVESKTVYLVTRTGQIMHFAWGGKLKQLDLAKLESPIDAKPMLQGEPKILVHPTKENAVFVVKAFSHDYGDRRLCSFLVIKFEDGKAVWQKTESVPNPLQNPQPDCHDYSWAVVAFKCQKSDNHGTFCIGLYRIQGSETSKLELCPCCEPQKRRGDWGSITFNVLTQTFRQREYLSTRFDVLWDGDLYHPLVDRNLMKLTEVHLWNDDLLLAATKTFDDQKTDIYLQTLHPVGNHRAPSPQWAPVRLSCIMQVGGNQVFQDDDFVILPTMGGLTLYEPSTTPSDGMVIDDTWRTHHRSESQLSCHLSTMSEMLELKHTEIGCGLTTRDERSRGRQESPPRSNTDMDQRSSDPTDSEDFEDH